MIRPPPRSTHTDTLVPYTARVQSLEAISTTQLVQPQAIEHLRYALEFLSMVRIRHQVDAIEQGQKPDNYIEPERFSTTERHNLKEAFQVLSNAQKFLRFRYPGHARPAR